MNRRIAETEEKLMGEIKRIEGELKEVRSDIKEMQSFIIKIMIPVATAVGTAIALILSRIL